MPFHFHLTLNRFVLMAHHVDLSVRPNRAFMQFGGIQLKCFNSLEVPKISVLEVTQTSTFDEAGFPVRGGLYDPFLGTSENNHCETCGMQGAHCPGHFGHIRLTVPVFNPLFYTFTFNMMKGTCIHCHRFTSNTNSLTAKIVIAKLRALHFGVSEILDMVESRLRAKFEKGDELLTERIDLIGESVFLREIDTFITELSELNVEQLLKTKRSEKAQLKNETVERNAIVKTFLREHLFKRRARCPHCKQPNGELRNDTGRTFLLDFSKQTGAERKKKEAVKKRLGEAVFNKLMNDAKTMEESKNFISTTVENDRPDLGFASVDIIDELESNEMKFGKAAALSSNTLIDPLEISEKLLNEQLRNVVSGQCDKLAWRAAEVREHFRLVWQRERILIRHLFPFFDEEEFSPVDSKSNEFIKRFSIDSLFIETVIVEPSRYRPVRFFKGERFEHPTTVNLRKLLEADQLLALIRIHLDEEKGGKQKLGYMAKELIDSRVLGKTMNEKLHNAYMDLQMRTNALFDRAANRVDSKASQPGLKQLLEKKEGLFRMHMMGKRVNFACRSVITPDPYLDIDEIGIPELFACRLTFPEPLCSLSHRLLKELVRRGPDNHPGANFVEFSGTIGKPPTRIKIPFGREAAKERVYLSTKLRFGDVSNAHAMPDYVLRHLQNGDKLLMNRQPSLHKPSIMGHKARILTGQNALRMNYAPCKAYNADFDGDEMNGHFIQNRIGQSEASELANVGNNYLVPKDGTPILGLIQDHVVAGVLMTIRGQFFSREDFMHLILAAFSQTKQRLHIPKPTIIWPARLWSGKQVITAIVHNCCPSDIPLINLNGKAKTGTACWKVKDPRTGKEMPIIRSDMNESEVIFRQGELLCGVLDKAHYGATQFGLIHCCYELYGPKVAVQVLSCFSRVFTTFLQLHGFTLGVTDILVTRKADRERKKAIRDLHKCGETVACKTFGFTEETPPEIIRSALASAYNHPRNDRSMVKLYDFTMKQTLNKYSEQINSACVPFGLIREFPQNSLQLMIQSGAKGSLVNAIQISCALGQIELEGQRPPRSVTGRSLPSFRSFDPTPRAGGFVSQRFLTGINPQELFFHTMAGREGLIDTAVKTSRSGYLQRCIIKHLEGIGVRYDHTVRDFDDSIIQFRYGEDGMDVGRATFLDPKLFQFLSQNVDTIRQNSVPAGISDEMEREQWHLMECEKQFRKISKFKRRRMRKMQADDSFTQNHSLTLNKGYRDSSFLEFCRHREASELKQTLVSEWSTMPKEKKAEFALKHPKAPTPVDAKFYPWTSLGALPERMLEQLEEFISKKCQTDKGNNFRKAICWKGLRALANPGENVGLLAAQSIGEPSTQMTLNTFHFAGRGEMNVTLGIPRLREILMTQGKNISTPLAEVCFYSDVSEDEIEKIKAELNPVLLRSIIKKFLLEERVFVNENGNFLREYSLHIALLDGTRRDPTTRHLQGRQILAELERRFGRQMAIIMAKRYKEVQEYQQIQHKKLRVDTLEAAPEEGSHRLRPEEDDLESDEEEAAGGVRSREADANEAKLSRRHLDDAVDYEGEEQDRTDAGIDEMERDDDNEEEMLQEGDENPAELDEHRESVMEEKSNEINADRIKSVLESHTIIGGYEYDVQNEHWCTFKFHMPFFNKTRIDVLAIAEREIENFVLKQVPGIEKCNVREEQRNGRSVRVLQTQGINLGAFYAHANSLDINTIYSNDIDFMLRNFGIEAAGRTIAREMNNVFGVYGIEVNSRHLTLTADYMTFTGEVQPFSRGAMADSASPLQKMTFETTVTFMREALISGQFDSLSSPSARLVMGQMIRCGTGAFELLSEPHYTLKGAKKGTKRLQKVARANDKRDSLP